MQKSNIPGFFHIEALEHINKKLKVLGGLIGITLNDNARNRFFLVYPELDRIASETEKLLGRENQLSSKHHELSTKIQKRQDENVLKIKAEFENTTNPFQCKNSELTHILTNRVFPKEVCNFVNNVAEIGKTAEKQFFSERIEKKKPLRFGLV